MIDTMYYWSCEKLHQKAVWWCLFVLGADVACSGTQPIYERQFQNDVFSPFTWHWVLHTKKRFIESHFMYILDHRRGWGNRENMGWLESDCQGSESSVKPWHTAVLVTWRYIHQTPLSRHPLDKDTLPWRAFFVPGESPRLSCLEL